MRLRKRTEGFNLAFLDIMACGLGAVILVFMIVKQNIDKAPLEIDNLKQDIRELKQAQADAQATLSEVSGKQVSEKERLATLSQQQDAMQSALANQRQDSAQSQQTLEQLKSDITAIELPEKQDLVATEQVNEENYLLGLKVEGQKIAILVDTSASMTHEKLIDIIKAKTGSAQNKQQSAKWRRTKQTLQWLLARLPANSEIVVAGFSDGAQLLGPNKSWQPSNSQTVDAILTDLNRVIPEGATNLQKALDTINAFSPSNLYLITDGLPTKGESRYKSLNPFASCSSLTGNAQTISGECRIKLFQQTIKESGRQNRQVNIILLPLEGDPNAAYQYWSWAAVTGGLVISPASNWP